MWCDRSHIPQLLERSFWPLSLFCSLGCNPSLGKSSGTASAVYRALTVFQRANLGDCVEPWKHLARDCKYRGYFSVRKTRAEDVRNIVEVNPETGKAITRFGTRVRRLKSYSPDHLGQGRGRSDCQLNRRDYRSSPIDSLMSSWINRIIASPRLP